jgi:hypothetical protein
MNNQNLRQMTPSGENQNDAEPEIDGWSAFWSVLLGVGFVVYVSFIRIGNAHTCPLYWRLQSLFVLLAAAAISAMALAGMTRATHPMPKPPAAQDLAWSTQHDLSFTERTHDPAGGGNDQRP